MQQDLLTPIENLSHVGPRNVSRLKRLGVSTLRDLLWQFPARYDDYQEVSPIADVQPGQKVSIQGEIVKITNRQIFPRHMTVTKAIVKDDSGAINAVWFNQPYIANNLTEGTLVSMAGKVNLGKRGIHLSSPTYEKIGNVGYGQIAQTGLTHTTGLVPTYPETEGVSSKYLRFLLKPILTNLELDDPLPEQIKSKYNLLSLNDAIRLIHYPEKQEDVAIARERLAFDDLFLFQIKALLERRKINQQKSISIKFSQELIKDFISTLPFELTRDQKMAAWEILKDLERPYPMNRLMEGDVGSGKTVVALIATVQAAEHGCQTVFMAPTEVLAQQHHRNIVNLLSSQITSVGLLTSSQAKLNGESIKKSELKKRISSGSVKIIIGTHAVIQKDVKFKNLALVIIDEQHRFGVAQRSALVKQEDAGYVPHLLSMTATPIPRTLALTIYGDLDISIIREKPKNRQKIITNIVTPDERNSAYQFIREEVGRGRQVFVICPRIELSDPKAEIKNRGAQSMMNILWADMKAVEEEYRKLSTEIFPEIKVAMLHGKMKAKEKNEIMDKFKNKEFDILVSTSVIEVGVDIPNATIMMIENAERFGLAQLHQFRGRVGRDIHQSYCLLFSSTGDKAVNKRLKALVDTDDGFLLAEKDMSIRGPGEFFGVKQSGLPDLAMASLANIELIKKARTEARLLLKQDPNLKKCSPLRERLAQFQKLTHFE
ncbi:MAG TPA: DNA helicase RecG [Candidatus Yanofskybacteria bacterium]|nr:DNA helicase RecG [Candidatus Yanofskybacteria bacterium]